MDNQVYCTQIGKDSMLWWSYDLEAIKAKAVEFVQDPVSHTVLPVKSQIDAEGKIFFSFINRTWSV
jgi:hypothetical protein